MKDIVWNSKKNRTNKTKLGISFDEASEVFFDNLALTVSDEEHSWEESRFVTVKGKDGKFCLKDLPKGNYVLRVGTRTREVEYFNSVDVIVKLNPKGGKNKEIKVRLTAAN